MKKIILSTILLFTIISLYAQRGKDGSKIVTAPEVVNAYTLLTANASIGDTSITVTNSSLNTNFSGNLAPGDLIMIIQLQGVSIIDMAWPGQTPDWGRVTSYNNCGNYEFVQVESVPNGTTINFDCALLNNYTAAGTVLIIRVPRYNTLTINSGGILTTSPWNGISGGILAVEVEGITTIDAGGSIDVSGLGFRGGIAYNPPSSISGSDRYANTSRVEGAEKGEGIAGNQAYYQANFQGMFGRGAAANAGGGANAHNAGGGGGGNAGTNAWNNGVGNPDISSANFITAWNLETSITGLSSSTVSSGGGRGGYSFLNNDRNELTVPPGDPLWGSSKREAVGGLGGRPLDYSTGRIFMGGAGGAGEGNNNQAGNGGNAGGMIFLKCYNAITGGGNIISNGADGGNSFGVAAFGQLAGKDGSGGGGAGGTIILQTTSTVSLSGQITANGGNGGNQILTASFVSITEGEGPGGSGGGGYIAISAGTPLRTANGGLNGTTNSPYVSNFNPNGATMGGVGLPNETISTFNLTANNATICPNTSTTLTATIIGTSPVGATIEWYDAEFNGNLLQTGNSFTTPILAVQTTYYIKTCPGTVTIPVTVFIDVCGVPPVPNFSSSDSTFCVGSCISFTDLSTNTPSGWTWYFFGSDSLTSNLQNPTNICYNTAGTFDVALVSSNPAGNDSLFMADFITVNALPNVVATANDTFICIGDTLILNGGGATSYTWDNSVINNIGFTPSTSILYTVTGIDTVTSCQNTDTLTVFVNNLPNVVANATDTVVCLGDSVKLYGSGTTNYLWNFGVIDNVNFSPASTNTYTVIGTDINGCNNTDSIKVTVGTCGLPPVSSFSSSDSTICLGTCLSFSDLSVNLPTSWTWYFFGSDSLTSNTQNPTNICYNTAGTFDVALVTSNAFGSDSLFVPNFITVFDLPMITTSPDDTVCIGSPANLSANGASTYVWDNGLGAGQNQTPIPLVPTTYTVTGTDTNGCVNAASINISLFSLPIIIPSQDTAICIGDTVKLRATGALTYLWDNGLGSIQNPTATPITPTTYTVTGTDTNGCVASSSVQVLINSLPTIIASNDDTICSGDTTTISASGGIAYSWDNGLSPTPSINPNEIVFPTITTTYTVLAADIKGCRNSDQVTVTVNSLPNVIANASDTVICLGDSVTLIGSGANSYVWYNNYGSIQPTVIFPTQGGWYLVQGTDTNGCKNIDRVIITVNTCTIPATNFNASDTTICMNNCIDFTDLSSSATPLFTWTWYFVGANPSSSTNQNPMNICYNNVGSYDVSLVTTNSLGSDSLFIPNYIIVDSCIISPTITPVVVVPNVFSPNGDGQNDLFKIDGIGIKTVAIKIYNRWGQSIFETSQFDEGWNGRTNSGKEVPEGTYFYIVDVETTTKTETLTGSLTLIR